MAIKLRQTIPDDLLATWKKCRRHGDTKQLQNLVGCSLPVIERALNIGFVAQDGLSEVITNFFLDRLKREQAQGDKLKTVLNENSSTIVQKIL